jgi:hypothetical protein
VAADKVHGVAPARGALNGTLPVAARYELHLQTDPSVINSMNDLLDRDWNRGSGAAE